MFARQAGWRGVLVCGPSPICFLLGKPQHLLFGLQMPGLSDLHREAGMWPELGPPHTSSGLCPEQEPQSSRDTLGSLLVGGGVRGPGQLQHSFGMSPRLPTSPWACGSPGVFAAHTLLPDSTPS